MKIFGLSIKCEQFEFEKYVTNSSDFIILPSLNSIYFTPFTSLPCVIIAIAKHSVCRQSDVVNFSTSCLSSRAVRSSQQKVINPSCRNNDIMLFLSARAPSRGFSLLRKCTMLTKKKTPRFREHILQHWQPESWNTVDFLTFTLLSTGSVYGSRERDTILFDVFLSETLLEGCPKYEFGFNILYAWYQFSWRKMLQNFSNAFGPRRVNSSNNCLCRSSSDND